MNDIQTSSIREIIKDFLSPADHFARLKANAAAMETSAWQEIGTWYDPMPDEFDCGFVDPPQVRESVTRICSVYGIEAVAETVLAYLYLKHRALFLKRSAYFHARQGGYYLCAPVDDDDDLECAEQVTAYGYSGCAAAQGDIVDFESLAADQISFPEFYPVGLLWKQLRSDHQLGLGLINYDTVVKVVEQALFKIVAERRVNPSALRVLDDLACRAQKIEREPRWMDHYLPLIAHALLLRTLQMS